MQEGRQTSSQAERQAGKLTMLKTYDNHNIIIEPIFSSHVWPHAPTSSTRSWWPKPLTPTKTPSTEPSTSAWPWENCWRHAGVRRGEPWKANIQTFVMKSWRKRTLSRIWIATWCQCHKTFYGRNLQIFIISWTVYPWQAFRAYSYKHSSFIRKLKNYGHKKFYNIGPWCQCHKTFFSCSLRMFINSLSVFPWQAFPV